MSKLLCLHFIMILFIILATEAHDDDGLPHTLEHIVFMGSEKYPYKVWSLYNFFSHIIY